jgi:hypothetical protein
MTHRTLVLAGLISGLAVVGVVWAVPKQANTKAPDQLAEARLKAARDAFEIAHGESIDREKMYRWSVRWLESEKALKPAKADQLAALQAHLERMKNVEEDCQVAFKKGLGTKFDVVAATFFRTEAETWLAEAKAK